ncbi:MAG: exodeoxyribonuclease V subunit beta [Syntrophorhabdus aromaticivorans]|uniref:DNA 3'-5' helicase n=1 Tax=Syntrophorhabdus aromaticivorans TaxID=328301 RepID=A0A971S1C4_9BACT|nr:exodeoxyribonuclease V subunit beta [Syntrophorhabdus aromaticivorans]
MTQPFDPLKASLSGRTLIEASAGTGKTYAIANLYLRLLVEENLKVEEVLVVTFTRAATEELKGRIRRRIVEAAQVFSGGETRDDFLAGFVAETRDRAEAGRRLTNALRGFDLAAIFTIHGFCLRMLHNHAFESGSLFDTGLMEDQGAVFQEIVNDFWRTNVYPMADDTFSAVVGDINRERLLALVKKCIGNPFLMIDGGCPHSSPGEPGTGSQPAGETVVTLRRQFIEYARKETARRKHVENVRSYDDLLADLYRALEGSGGAALAHSIRSRYRAALVDEFQDTDPLQYEIFKIIYGRGDGTLFLIGDPKQSIYSFRGADIFSYMRAANDVDRQYTLDKNWRSTAGLLKAVNAIFAKGDRPFVFESVPFWPVEPGRTDNGVELTVDNVPDPAPFKLWFIGRDGGRKHVPKGAARSRVGRAVADEIVKLLTLGTEGRARIHGRPLHAGDMAILVPTNWEAREMQKALKEARVPCVVYSTESIFGSGEAEELERLMAAILEPADDARVKAALATDLMGLSGDDLALLIEDEKGWDAWIERLEAYRSQWMGQGFITMARTLTAQESVKRHLRTFPDGERRITNLLHCLELLHSTSVEKKLGMEGLLKWLREKRENEKTSEAEEYQIRLETDERAVKIITIHKSKGLEYPIVFCPFSWGNAELGKNGPVVYHDRDKNFQSTLDITLTPGEKARHCAEVERLAENIRLLYVTLTRAQCRSYLAWGSINESETSALAYLLHSPSGRWGDFNLSALKNQMKDRRDEEMVKDLEALVERSGGSIELSMLPEAAGLVYTPPLPEGETLRCRVFSGSIDDGWRTSSFSALISGREHAAELPDRDREYRAETIIAPVGHGEEGKDVEASERVILSDFPKGAVAGTCLHDILEHVDFSLREVDSVRNLIRARLESYGFDPGWENTVYEAVRNVLTTPIPGGESPFSLSMLGAEDRLHEVEFYAPLELITSRKLGEVFQSCGGAGISRDFPDLLLNLGFKPVKGMLRGFIDMVFQAQGKYYLVDWKSNFLGVTPESYSKDRLRYVMEREFYILQYHIYAVMLHRFLAARLKDYGYEHHFGGVYYVFLRGVDPLHGLENGIYFDKPSTDCIDALARCLAGEQ